MLYQKLLDAHKRYRQFKTYPHIADQYWSSQLAEHNINPNYVEYDAKSGQLFYKEKKALAFNRDRCCPLALCLRLILFH